MSSYNKVILLGNLVRDPELSYTPKGTALAKLTLALNHKWMNDAGETKEEVTFVDVVSWGKQGETLAQYLKKGSALFMEGRLKLDQWEDKQTRQKRSKLSVVMESFQFVGERSEGAHSNPAAVEAKRPVVKPVARPFVAAPHQSIDEESGDPPF